MSSSNRSTHNFILILSHCADVKVFCQLVDDWLVALAALAVSLVSPVSHDLFERDVNFITVWIGRRKQILWLNVALCVDKQTVNVAKHLEIL